MVRGYVFLFIWLTAYFLSSLTGLVLKVVAKVYILYHFFQGSFNRISAIDGDKDPMFRGEWHSGIPCIYRCDPFPLGRLIMQAYKL